MVSIRKFRRAPRHYGRVAFALATAAVGACTTVQLVSRYDDQTDAAAMQMQKDVSAFLIRMQTASSDQERTFAANQQFYRQQAVQIDAMQLRARAIAKNAITIEQLGLVEENLAYLALLHKGCVTAPLGAEQKAAVRNAGVDASLGCHTAYGGAVDDPDRGQSTLSPQLAAPIRSLIDTELGAVVALELAKKRGE